MGLFVVRQVAFPGKLDHIRSEPTLIHPHSTDLDALRRLPNRQ